MRDDHRFSDDEVRKIFARAADRESAALPVLGAEAGLSIGQLRAVARDTGMDPDLVEAAAHEIAAQGAAAHPGAPLHARAIRHLPVMPDKTSWERIVRELRDRFGVRGVASDLGHAREWSSTAGRAAGEPPPVVVRVEETEGRARVMLTQILEPYRRIPDLVGGGLGFFGLLYAAGGPLMGQAETGLLTALALLSSGLLGSVGGRALLRRWRRVQEERLDAVADRISLIAREGADTPSGTPTVRPPRA